MKFIVVSDKTIERSIAESQILDDIEKSKKKDTIINKKDDKKDTKDDKVITNPPPENKKDDKKDTKDDKVIINKNEKKDTKDDKVVTTPPPENKKDDKKDTKDDKVVTTPPPENKVKDDGGLNLDDISKYSNPNSSKNITMKDFGPQNPSGKVIPKPKKPLMKNSPAAKAGIPIETRQKFADMNAAFQATKNKDSGYNKMDFIKDFPKSQTAKKFNQGKPIPGFKYNKNIKSSYEPYHVVLGYVLSEGHADTIDEAHYVMTQMDSDTIQEIVALDEGPIATAAAVTGAMTLGAMGLNAIRKMMNNKKTMDQGGKFKKGSTLDNIQKKNEMLKNM